MYEEYERRFLVADVGDVPGLHRADGYELIVQGYLAVRDGAALRIRRRIGMHGDPATFLFQAEPQLEYKGPRSDGRRREHPWPATEELADVLMRLSLGVVQKYRFAVNTTAGPCELDEFLFRNHGLLIAEFESDTRQSNFSPPNWCGLEVTGERRFDNEQLALNPIGSWSSADLRRFGLRV